jgi:hypothetical protein
MHKIDTLFWWAYGSQYLFILVRSYDSCAVHVVILI